jgi:hypothetical protein
MRYRTDIESYSECLESGGIFTTALELELFMIDLSVDGGLAVFCPACPQMDINIPPETEWKADDR